MCLPARLSGWLIGWARERLGASAKGCAGRAKREGVPDEVQVCRIALAGVVLAFALLGGAQSASASSIITRVTPEQGCPGEKVTIEGGGFEVKSQVVWEDKTGHQPGSWEKVQVKAIFVNSTKLTAIVPMFIQIEGNGSGTLSVGSAHYSPFIYTALEECFGARLAPKGKKGKLVPLVRLGPKVAKVAKVAKEDRGRPERRGRPAKLARLAQLVPLVPGNEA
jgi:hypothetical protein